MPPRAKELRFVDYTFENDTFHFDYEIDGEKYSIDLAHSDHSNLPEKTREKIGFNIGMCHLIDLVEITLPEKIYVFKDLPLLALGYWRNLAEEVVVEKLYEYKLPTSIKYFQWEYGEDPVDLTLDPLPKNRDKAAICLTGGKESMSIFKTLKDKKPIMLFFLNAEADVHTQRVFDAVKNDYETVRTISNRDKLYKELQEKYSGFPSGVDMAHLVYNTMLFADTVDYVLIGNEYSSNFPNTIYEGQVVNHQYVKTIRFAEQINRYVHEFVTEDFSYYSPFFGMYELLISRLLFKNDDYLDVWTSCNQTTETVNFCSNCHKCAFTYLIGRQWKSVAYLLRFFSRDMMQDVDLYKPLMDFTGVKPMDCVGDKAEVWVCLEQLMRKGEDNPVISYYKEHIRPEIESEINEDIRQITSVQRVAPENPKDLEAIFQAALEQGTSR